MDLQFSILMPVICLPTYIPKKENFPLDLLTTTHIFSNGSKEQDCSKLEKTCYTLFFFDTKGKSSRPDCDDDFVKIILTFVFYVITEILHENAHNLCSAK